MDHGFIYKITNLVNGKIYIGQTVQTIERRWLSGHCAASKKPTLLQRAIKKYGKDSFSVEIVEIQPLSLLDVREIYWIAHYNSSDTGIGYNLTSGGNSNKKISESSRQKMAAAKLGKSLPKSEAACKSISESAKRRYQNKENHPWYGKRHTQASIEKCRFAQKDKMIPVVGVDKDGNRFRFESLSHATRNGYSASHIRSCIIGKRMSHKGLRWQRA
jgi:group I intron endonuclease